ncbi:MAG: EcsC family protein [Candidatus Acidiferrales bacterium]
MARKHKKRLSIDLLKPSVLAGLRTAYEQVRVDPEKYLRHVRRAHRLPIQCWSDMFLLGPEVVDPMAERAIVGATRIAALEGMGLGIGGVFTLLPDMGILSGITIRLLQKLSLLYGFEYSNEEEVAELWIAAASAAGLDLGREFVEKQAIERLVPRIIDRIAVKMSAEIAEKWTGRIIPVVSAGIGGVLNYYFVRTWGRRAQKHFRTRHLEVRGTSYHPLLPKPVQLIPSRTT